MAAPPSGLRPAHQSGWVSIEGSWTMVASLLTTVLAAALAQGPAESAWLKNVPSDVDAVVRVKGLEAAKNDLVGMIQAMSPTLAEQAKPALDEMVTQLAGQYGKVATTSPFVVML